MPPTSAPARGSEPGRCANTGVRFDQSPRPSPKPQMTRKPRSPSLSAASTRSTPEPSPTPRTFTAAKSQIAADRHAFECPWREWHEVAHVARQANGHRRRDARVGHQHRQPAEQKGDSWSVSFLQVDVRSAGLGMPRRQGTEANRASRRASPGHQPDEKQPERRAQRFRHAGRRQENPHPDHLAHHQRRGCRQAELTGERGFLFSRFRQACVSAHSVDLNGRLTWRGVRGGNAFSWLNNPRSLLPRRRSACSGRARRSVRCWS